MSNQPVDSTFRNNFSHPEFQHLHDEITYVWNTEQVLNYSSTEDHVQISQWHKFKVWNRWTELHNMAQQYNFFGDTAIILAL